ncbi:peptide/nickel transport system ATP-binding protein [Sagittula marina]|uniref:Peptide/nickel transport system ATP-binding protein n=1 Tax=Sagittula marina TaxID=943940 RepID=A0A7W6DLV1_9RHOB|nr:ATP-binding cassette domain-containing protein [Sagittula marina]MBB3984969.1 peptide/nickel transport system ATP-binding protein [Sagittula marina]
MSFLTATDITVRDGAQTLLEPLSLTVTPGEPLIILGETGSGKSLMAQAIMGTLPAGLRAQGEVRIGAHTLSASEPRRFRGLWGREISVLPQEPWLSLDPLMRAGTQVTEAHRLVRGLSAADAKARASSDLGQLGLTAAARHYPHQLSGGMAQRVAIAAARAGGAGIVIADEPTKGLDAARRDDVADLLLSEMGDNGGLLVITHDLALARRMGGQMIVLRQGKVVETGATETVMSAAREAYTRALLAADPESWTRRAPSRRDGPPVVDVHGLSVARGGRELFSGVGFDVAAGGVFGITGPSGCGKSTLGDAVLGLVAPAAGTVTRRADIGPHGFQKLYQDPVAAFPRKRRLGETLNDVARMTGESARVAPLLEQLGLSPTLLERRPGAVSGGELQRLSILRALLRRPALIFADEPTSRLDPITQARVIGMLGEIAMTEGTAILLVSHDAALVRNTADAVLPLGKTVLPEPQPDAASVATAPH